jgi:uncharacterized protein (DUF697 family)/GTP-binding protein EngB required for normal cell division
MMKPNVLICGQTGVGKSSVVNFLFKKNVADIGNNGEACSRGITLYEGELLNIYDSEGYEIGEEKQSEYKTMLEDFLRTKTGNEAVQVVWYAISGAGNRYTSLDLEIIRSLSDKKYMVCILLTKIDEMEESQMNDMYNDISRDISPLNVFKTSNKDYVQTFCDWNALTMWTCTAWQDALNERTATFQRLEENRKQARIAVTAATVAAAGVGASPIPFSDAFLLAPIQTAMILKVTSLYDIHLAEGVVTSIVGTILATALGRSVAGNLIKLIPGIGSIAGAAINASTAGIITTAIGNALIAFCHKRQQDILEGKSNVQNMEEILASKDFIKQVLDNAKKEKEKNK